METSSWLIRYCWVLFPVLGVLYGVAYWMALSRERWASMYGELRAELPVAMREILPAVDWRDDLPGPEALAEWRAELDDNSPMACEILDAALAMVEEKPEAGEPEDDAPPEMLSEPE